MVETSCKADIKSIQKRLSSLPEGDFAVTSIGVKNYLMWAGGSWEPDYDYAMHDLFANSKRDLTALIDDLSLYKHTNQKLMEIQKQLTDDIEKLRVELGQLRNSLTDDMR